MGHRPRLPGWLERTIVPHPARTPLTWTFVAVALAASLGRPAAAGRGFPLPLGDKEVIDGVMAEHWGEEDGLPQSSVTGFTEDSEGFLWLTTFGGLVRFDGHV